jgi:transcriptional regulator with XRE-family HTH domain
MYGASQRRSDPDVQGLRRAGGIWLRGLRESRGLSQRELARLVGAEYYTFISQLETGRGRVPPDRYRLWASALKVDPKIFVKRLLSYYDPITYDILFDDQGVVAAAGDDCSLAEPLSVEEVPQSG